jgi:glycosyltransferase involved in cell wall biosynthesis
MIPTYNRTTYLERALCSVLSQDPGAAVMQIEVVDNASPVDDPEPLVRRVGGDRVSFVRQPRNIGMFPNFNSCIERSRGHWVQILSDDDVVFPGFYERFRPALEGRNEVGAGFCRNAFIDENERWLYTSELESPTSGILPGFIERIGVNSIIQCSSAVVRRSVYEQLGGFRTDFFAADWELWIRIAARYPIWYEPETLAAWRRHSLSCTTAIMRSAENVADARRCIEISYFVLPPDRADTISRNAKERLAFVAVSTAYGFGRKEFRSALNQIREGLKCSHSPRVIKALLVMLGQLAMAGARKVVRRSRERLLRVKAS